MPLFEYRSHSYTPRNINALHQEEQAAARFNVRLAVLLTRATGTMACAYFFILLALLGFPALSAWLGPQVALYVVCGGKQKMRKGHG